MTAPAAPVIRVHALGTAVRIDLTAVSGAATYDVYEAGTTAPTTLLQAGFTTLPITLVPLNEPSFIRVKAVNAGAEASAYSNEVMVGQGSGNGNRLTTHDPFGAYDHRD